jgi:hypothetical protein
MISLSGDLYPTGEMVGVSSTTVVADEVVAAVVVRWEGEIAVAAMLVAVGERSVLMSGAPRPYLHTYEVSCLLFIISTP